MYRAKLQKLENLTFAVKILESHTSVRKIASKTSCFYMLTQFANLRATVQKWPSGPKLVFAFESTRQTAAADRLPARFWTQKRHQNTRLFKIVCFDAIESTRDFASSDVRSASTASRSYFRVQRVRDNLEPQLSLEHRVRDKSTHGPSAPRPESSKHPSFLKKGSQDSFYL